MARRSPEMKEEIKNNIIKVAMTLFLDKGIASTSMQEIADSVDISHRTLYRYFKDKDELACTIALIQRGQLEDINDAAQQTQGTGYERIQRHTDFLMEFQHMESTLRTTRFLAEYDYYVTYVSRGMQNESLTTLNNLTARYEGLLAEMLRVGQADGSIRKDVDPINSASMFVHLYIFTVHQRASCCDGGKIQLPPNDSYLQNFFLHYLKAISTKQ